MNPKEQQIIITHLTHCGLTYERAFYAEKIGGWVFDSNENAVDIYGDHTMFVKLDHLSATGFRFEVRNDGILRKLNGATQRSGAGGILIREEVRNLRHLIRLMLNTHIYQDLAAKRTRKNERRQRKADLEFEKMIAERRKTA